MTIEHLTDEQVRTMSRLEKDRWWMQRVFRGDMPQLTIRSAITGFVLGGILSATNLYIGAKTGWSLGVGITSVIIAFAAFKTLEKLGLAKQFTILENNAMQSIATAAGYMTAPLISSLAAFMLVKNEVLPWWQIMCFTVVVSLMGVLVAFPMKRRFINDEQQPFPEGRACGVVLDALYTANSASGMIKAKALAVAAGIAALVQFVMGEAYQELLQGKWLGFKKILLLPERLDAWWYEYAAKNNAWMPTIAGIDIRQLGLIATLDISMIGAGGLMGVRIANSLMIGCIANYAIIAPWMIQGGEIVPKNLAAIVTPQGTFPMADALFGRGYLLNSWCLWWGIALMVTASLVSLVAKPQVIISAFTGVFKRVSTDAKNADPVRNIELPLWISFVGVPALAAVSVLMGWSWFGMNPWLGLLSIPLILVLSLIAANATALTSTTPTGSLSKITQFTFGALDRANPATNLITAGMTSEVASNASNLLMDIKPGYMLGAKPRQQAWGHCIGIFAGAIASTPLFFLLFLTGYKPGEPVEKYLATDKFPMPGATIWKGVSDMIAKGTSVLSKSALTAMVIACVAAIAMEIARITTKGKFPLSALAIGLGVVLPPESTLMMFVGAQFFSIMKHRYEPRVGSTAKVIWVESQEPICAGLIAGAALTGIGDKLVQVLVLG